MAATVWSEKRHRHDIACFVHFCVSLLVQLQYMRGSLQLLITQCLDAGFAVEAS